MLNLLSTACPIIVVGALVGLLYPHQPAAVLTAQALFVAFECIGRGVSVMLHRRRNG
jgi:hypothetical protein